MGGLAGRLAVQEGRECARGDVRAVRNVNSLAGLRLMLQSGFCAEVVCVGCMASTRPAAGAIFVWHVVYTRSSKQPNVLV